jgi:hypothetical protein
MLPTPPRLDDEARITQDILNHVLAQLSLQTSYDLTLIQSRICGNDLLDCSATIKLPG